MNQTGAQDVDSSEEGAEAPLPRGKQLESLLAVRREMTRIYWSARGGKMDMDKAKGLVHILGQVSAILKAEANSPESEIAALLAKLKEKLQ